MFDLSPWFVYRQCVTWLTLTLVNWRKILVVDLCLLAGNCFTSVSFYSIIRLRQESLKKLFSTSSVSQREFRLKTNIFFLVLLSLRQKGFYFAASILCLIVIKTTSTFSRSDPNFQAARFPSDSALCSAPSLGHLNSGSRRRQTKDIYTD